MKTKNKLSSSSGVYFALGAYLWWGFVTPIYFKFLDNVDSLELLAWRSLSGLPILIFWLYRKDSLKTFFLVFKDLKAIRVLLATSFLIGLNWFTFIFATVENRLSEASLGYYICPLVSVFLGYFFLRESITKFQKIGIFLAIVGVSIPIFQLNNFPWITVVLAFSFSLYGLLRKQLYVDSATGLTFEMLFLFPFMFVLDLYIHSQGQASFLTNYLTSFMILIGGFVTLVPLVLFTAAAHRLRLITVGIMQYISPTGQFLVTLFIFNEVISTSEWISFCFVWLAVFLYALDMLCYNYKNTK